MYRAYFVDDEPFVLEELINHPAFLECGFWVAGSSVNPINAKKEIKKLGPDVVFSDLKMPGCSGVELMEELRKDGAACEFVIISAYEEFQALRSFLKMDGFDYLTKPIQEYELRSVLNKLAGKIAGKRPLHDMEEKTSSPELNRLTAYLKESLTLKHSLESTSEALGIHPKQISRLFANHLGTTFVAYLTKLRMEESAKLLKTTRKDIKEISALCGFPDYFYFCRVFREYYSCTPTTFREESSR